MRARANIAYAVCAILIGVVAQADPVPPPASPPPTDPVLALGDFVAAEQAYQAALVKTPNDANSLAGLARIRLYQERRIEARSLANRALASDAANPLAPRVIAGVAARDASFGSDVYRFTLPRAGIRVPFFVTDPLPLVRVQIGKKTVLFLIDTGAPDLVLDKNFAAELGLAVATGGQGVFAGGTRTEIAHAILPSIRMGAVLVSNVPVALLPTRNFDTKRRIDGIVGTGFLMHFLSTLDYKHGALILQPRNSSTAFESAAAMGQATVVQMWLVGDHFLFAQGRINHGPEGLYNIDTGLKNGGVQATRATLDESGIKIDEALVRTGQGGGGPVRFVPFRTSATIGKLTANALNGIYTPDGDQYGLFPFGVAGTISHQFFREHALTLDFEAMKLVIR